MKQKRGKSAEGFKMEKKREGTREEGTNSL